MPSTKRRALRSLVLAAAAAASGGAACAADLKDLYGKSIVANLSQNEIQSDYSEIIYVSTQGRLFHRNIVSGSINAQREHVGAESSRGAVAWRNGGFVATWRGYRGSRVTLQVAVSGSGASLSCEAAMTFERGPFFRRADSSRCRIVEGNALAGR